MSLTRSIIEFVLRTSLLRSYQSKTSHGGLPEWPTIDLLRSAGAQLRSESRGSQLHLLECLTFPVWSKISNVLERLGFRSRNFSHSCFLKPQEHVQSGFDDQVYGGSGMIWARMLAYITGTVDQELLLRNEYLATENRILRAQIQGRLLLSTP